MIFYNADYAYGHAYTSKSNNQNESSYDGLGLVDYVVLTLILLISSSIGIYYRFSGGRQKTTKVKFQNSEMIA